MTHLTATDWTTKRRASKTNVRALVVSDANTSQQHNTVQRRRQRDPLYPIIHLSFAVYERPTRNRSKFIRTKINRDSDAEQAEQRHNALGHAGKKNRDKKKVIVELC